MDFRTIVHTGPSEYRIGYNHPVMFVGSCFATGMSEIMARGKMNVLANPTGTLFNPVSVMNTLDLILENRLLQEADLYNHNGTWISFLHYTNFSSDDPAKALQRINDSTRSASRFLRNSAFLFITFGTARIYRFRKSGITVSNCHRLPAGDFTQELLTVDETVRMWTGLLDRLQAFNGNLKVIFTVSPVRHWKDGAHGNQISKSVLFLSIEQLLSHPLVAGYFPAYEILMDDLRDYRFYDKDMLHPSASAVEYIWDRFSESFLTAEALDLWKRISPITAAVNHRIASDSPSAIEKFASLMLKQIDSLSERYSGIDLKSEGDYFRALLTGSKKS